MWFHRRHGTTLVRREAVDQPARVAVLVIRAHAAVRAVRARRRRGVFGLAPVLQVARLGCAVSKWREEGCRRGDVRRRSRDAPVAYAHWYTRYTLISVPGLPLLLSGYVQSGVGVVVGAVLVLVAVGFRGDTIGGAARAAAANRRTANRGRVGARRTTHRHTAHAACSAGGDMQQLYSAAMSVEMLVGGRVGTSGELDEAAPAAQGRLVVMYFGEVCQQREE